MEETKIETDTNSEKELSNIADVILPDNNETSNNSGREDVSTGNEGVIPRINPEKEEHDNSVLSEYTFPTTTEGMNIILHSEEAKSSVESDDIERKQFLAFLGDNSPGKPKSQPQRKHQKRIFGQPPLSREEIIRICDQLIGGKSLKLEDSGHIMSIIEELNSRRVQALSDREYLKSKKIEDLIESVKTKLHQKDRESMFKDNLAQLQERHQASLISLSDSKKLWKDKEAELNDIIKKELYEIEQKHREQHEELEDKWLDPSMIRRFNKKSKELLQKKTIEKYMVLSGNLEEAEALKKENKSIEKKEAEFQYQAMLESFETAREKLIQEQTEEMNKQKSDHEFQKKILQQEATAAIEVMEKRVQTTQKALDEGSQMDKFFAKKFKKSSDKILPLSALTGLDDLPPLSRTKGVGYSPTIRESNGAVPLNLPPLKMKSIRNRKVSTK